MFPARSLLLITFLTSCNVASAAVSSTNLRGSGDVSSSITAISSSPIDKEERQLRPDHAGSDKGGSDKGGNGKNKEEATTTTEATAPQPVTTTAGAAEAPLPGTTSTVAPADCNKSCDAGEICAREEPTSEAQCYTQCPADAPPVLEPGETCGTGDKCVFDLDVNDVYIQWCDCKDNGTWECAAK